MKQEISISPYWRETLRTTEEDGYYLDESLAIAGLLCISKGIERAAVGLDQKVQSFKISDLTYHKVP